MFEWTEGDGAHGAVTAVVADDDPMARRLLRQTLSEQGIRIVAEARTAHEATEQVRYFRPDALLVDDAMADLDGLALTRRVRMEMPETLVIVLTASYDEEVGVCALRAGAAGFISKDTEPPAIARAVRGAVAGEAAISRRLAMRLVEGLHAAHLAHAGLRPIHSTLTDREWEVLHRLVGGASLDEMARDLFVSSETVRSHLKRIYRKLGVHSRDEAVLAAQRMLDADVDGLPA